MVIGFLLVFALQQPQVTATVNRTEVAVGDTLVLNITATTEGSGFFHLSDPPLEGLEIYGRRQVSSVQIVGGEEHRQTSRTFYLRASNAGEGVIGRATLQHGSRSIRTSPIRIAIAGRPDPVDQFTPFVASLIPLLQPPEGDEVTVSILTSADSVLLGEQLDLVVVAWFPRALRSRLRNPPTLDPPQVQGAWTYSRNSPAGVVSTREVAGEVYDLYVHHQTVFPLSVDGFEIGRASVTYNLPLSFSFLSRELRYVVQSQVPQLQILTPPLAERPENFQGAVAKGLEMDLEVGGAELEVGEAGNVAIVLSGTGNVALWPEPTINWPGTLSVYPSNVTFDVLSVDGVIGGTKRFNYLVVPDSAGVHRITPEAYSYFDLETSSYEIVRAGAQELASPLSSGRIASRPTALGLAEVGGMGIADGVLRGFPVWMWILIAALAPLGALATTVRANRSKRTERTANPPTPIEEAARRLGEIFDTIVPEWTVSDGTTFEEALCAAGLERSLATHAVRLRERLSEALYGPEGSSDSEELLAEVQEVTGVLNRALVVGGPAHSGLPIANVMLLFLLLPGAAWAQANTAETLYGAGAYIGSAESFASRATLEPRVASNWINLGNARYMAGDETRARISWVRAARIAPRNWKLRRSLSLVGRGDRRTRTMMWISLVTPAEALALGIGCWFLGWLMFGLGKRNTMTAGVLLAAVLFAGYGFFVSRSYDSTVAVVLNAATPLRSAPYGVAEAVNSLDGGTAVKITDAEGPWLLVRRGNSEGWLLSTEVERL